MAKYALTQFPNLEFATEAFEEGVQGKLPIQVKEKMLEALAFLNEFGTNPAYSGKRIENTGREKIWELKIKGPSKTEWRFLFKKIKNAETPNCYGLLYFFLKQDESITDREFRAAIRIAKREGW
jgi:hypothetical protein